VKKRFALVLLLLVVAIGVVSPLYAQEPTTAAASKTVEIVRWSIITAGFALAFAAAFGALAQGRSISAAVEAIARNPSATNDIRGNLILGLVLIESLVIYVLLISLILFFLKPFGA
jgi:F-type H+-transporting ATPase subunit c